MVLYKTMFLWCKLLNWYLTKRVTTEEGRDSDNQIKGKKYFYCMILLKVFCPSKKKNSSKNLRYSDSDNFSKNICWEYEWHFKWNALHSFTLCKHPCKQTRLWMSDLVAHTPVFHYFSTSDKRHQIFMPAESNTQTANVTRLKDRDRFLNSISKATYLARYLCLKIFYLFLLFFCKKKS